LEISNGSTSTEGPWWPGSRRGSVPGLRLAIRAWSGRSAGRVGDEVDGAGHPPSPRSAHHPHHRPRLILLGCRTGRDLCERFDGAEPLGAFPLGPREPSLLTEGPALGLSGSARAPHWRDHPTDQPWRPWAGARPLRLSRRPWPLPRWPPSRVTAPATSPEGPTPRRRPSHPRRAAQRD
jgi:hypothetical protein